MMAARNTKASAKTADVSVVKTASAARKPAAKKAGRPAKAAEEKKVNVKLQYGVNEVAVEDIVAACKADYKAKTNGHVRSIDVYIKPEDLAVYYVVNKKYNDKIDL